MRYTFGRSVIIGLGGSIVYPENIDAAFVKAFKKFVLGFLRKKRFVIVLGGGRLSRLFQEAAQRVARVVDDDKDWLGIHATRLNAQLLRTVFQKVADPTVIDKGRKLRRLRYPVTIASGWRPGWSTDYVAVALAAEFGIREIIIAGKPSHVYDKDNSRYENARPIKELSWIEYQKLIPKKWTPGLHAPVDPVAARLAQKNGVTAIIINGKDLKNFGNLLNGREFEGSIIRN